MFQEFKIALSLACKIPAIIRKCLNKHFQHFCRRNLGHQNPVIFLRYLYLSDGLKQVTSGRKIVHKDDVKKGPRITVETVKPDVLSWEC